MHPPIVGFVVSEVVLDPGPLPYSTIDLAGDPDLDQILIDDGMDPRSTSYRLIEIPVSSIAETKTMDQWKQGSMLSAGSVPAVEPPVVVYRTPTGWGLLDGVHRTYAAWKAGRSTIRAYELLPRGRDNVPNRCR